MTSRLPRGLKKRLEASLESLAPREAGRLFLIYLHEATKKGRALDNYPPIKDLWDAWELRVEKARGTPRERQEIMAYNGFVLLSTLISQANIATDRDLFRLAFITATAANYVEKSLLVDYVGTIAHMTIGLLDDLPKPAGRDEYDMLTAFAKSEQVRPLDEVAYDLAFDLIEDMGGVEIEVARRKANLTAEELNELADMAGLAAEELAGLAAEELPEMITEELDELITEELTDRVALEFLRLLESWVEKGDWGGLAAGPWNCYSLIPIVEGTIPTWAALRAIWPRWLRDHGFLIRERPAIYPDALEGLMSVYDVEGDLEGDRLVAVVANFVADCRNRPWGSGLASDIDPAGLALFLIERENPITYRKAPDLGRTDWEVFRSREGDESPDWEPADAATILDLKGRSEDLGVAPDRFDTEYVWEMYYLSHRPQKDRAGRSLITNLQKHLQVSHRPFTYARKGEGDLLPPGEVLGVKFATPLEERVKYLGVAFGEYATFMRKVAILSAEYFGGLPVLLPDNAERLSDVEQVLQAGERELQAWLTKLEEEKWGIDTASLRLVKPEADEVQARQWVDDIVMVAKRIARINEDLIDLGNDPGKGAK